MTRDRPVWPTFILAGVPKTGSTALYNYLRQHPQVYLIPIKEPCYFAAQDLLEGPFRDKVRYFLEQRGSTLETYLRGPMEPLRRSELVLEREQYLGLFRDARDEIAIGEASVSYFWLPSSAAAIAAQLPQARLVFMFRHPAERAYSQHLASGYYDTHETFRDRFVGSHDPGSNWWAWYQAGLYGTHLRRFLDIFPREQVLVHLYEDYRQDPHAVLRSVFAFIGVDPAFQPDFSRRHNEPAVPRFPRVHRLRWKLFGRTRLTRLLPAGLRQRFRRFYLRRRAELAPMDPADRQLVVDTFRDEVRQLQELIGRDLAHWLR